MRLWQVEVANRCFPTTNSEVGNSRQLCGLPPCTDQDFNLSMGGHISCTHVESLPDVHTAWEICPSSRSGMGDLDEESDECKSRASRCELQVSN